MASGNSSLLFLPLLFEKGVIKTLEMTKSHLRQLYDNLPYRYYPYDSSKLSDVRQFAFSDSIEIFVMTIDSFNKASNRIYHPTDSLQGEVPIHFRPGNTPYLDSRRAAEYGQSIAREGTRYTQPTVHITLQRNP